VQDQNASDEPTEKPMPPTVRRLLDAAYDAMATAKELQARGRHADALACALFANEYVRAARSLTDMDALHA
jgi:hypothetical protein